MPKMSHFGCFWLFLGYRKWHFGCPNQNSKTTFQYKYPPKPPIRHFGGNYFGPRKSDFWPFYCFWSFSYWNSHWSRKILPPWEGVELQRKQNMFWDKWSNENNLGIGNMHNLISKTTLALILSAIYRATFSVYKDQTKVPCEAGQNLMSPAVGTLRLLLFGALISKQQWQLIFQIWKWTPGVSAHERWLIQNMIEERKRRKIAFIREQRNIDNGTITY